MTIENPGTASAVGGSGWTCTSTSTSFSCYTDTVFASGQDLPVITVKAKVGATAPYESSLMNYSCVRNNEEASLNDFGGNNCDEANVIITTPVPVACTPGTTTGNQTNPVTASTAGLCPAGKAVGDFVSTPVGTTVVYTWSCNGSTPG